MFLRHFRIDSVIFNRFINDSTLFLLHHLRASNLTHKFLAVEEAKSRHWCHQKLLVLSKSMVRVFPCRLITNNEHVEWQFQFLNLLINLIVVGLDVDAKRTPLFTVLVLVACEEHYALDLVRENSLQNLRRFEKWNCINLPFSRLVLEMLGDLL